VIWMVGHPGALEQGGRPWLEAAGAAAQPAGAGGGGGGEDGASRREQGAAGAVEVVAVVVVTDQHGVDWVEVGGGDRRPVNFRELESQPKLYQRPRGVEARVGQQPPLAHLDQGHRAADVGDAGGRHAPAFGACRALPWRACLTAHSRA
jgi:hypothetical protein